MGWNRSSLDISCNFITPSDKYYMLNLADYKSKTKTTIRKVHNIGRQEREDWNFDCRWNINVDKGHLKSTHGCCKGSLTYGELGTITS